MEADETIEKPVLTLPDAEAQFLRDRYEKSDVILEYGSGGSTFVGAELGARKIMSVESDENWALNMNAAVAKFLPDHGGIHIHQVDIGKTKAWGYPRNHQNWAEFHKYPLSIWDQGYFEAPDTVLIDGRFRVACFLTVLLKITKPTTVLFDDYVNRRNYHSVDYHYVEKFAKPVDTIGRMARFEFEPTELDRSLMTEIVGWFNVVN